jgi:exonuclease III
MRLVSWNVSQHRVSWEEIEQQGADIALLQEVMPPPANCRVEVIPADRGHWSTAGWRRPWRTAIARLAPDVALVERPTTAMDTPGEGIVVSRPGSLTVADVVVEGKVEFTAVSMYAAWESPAGRDRPIYADASAHRLLSDLSALVTSPGRHRIVAAGDLNILYGYGEHGDTYWADRYATVFDRAERMGLRFVGPKYTKDGPARRADPWPGELPPNSLNVPTYHTNRSSPAGATRQLDFVFVSAPLEKRVQATALNAPEEWGASDHCRVMIDVDL